MAIAVVIFGCWLAVGSAYAHAPYLAELQPWVAPDGRSYNVGMLYGDGIFAPDPGRPVVVIDDQVVAIGPLSTDGIVRCGGKNCQVILNYWEKVIPEPAQFRDGIAWRVGPGDRGGIAPQYHKTEYGFRSEKVSTADYATIAAALLGRRPQGALFLVALVAILGSLAAIWAWLARAWLRSAASDLLAIVALFFVVVVGASSVVMPLFVLLMVELSGSNFAGAPLLCLLVGSFLVSTVVLRRVRPPI